VEALAIKPFAMAMVYHLAAKSMEDVSALARAVLVVVVAISVLRHIRAIQPVEKAALVLQIVMVAGLPLV